MITRDGRATPLVWKTVAKATLAGKRNDYEYSVVEQLGSALQGDVKITLLAERGFGDQKFTQGIGRDHRRRKEHDDAVGARRGVRRHGREARAGAIAWRPRERRLAPR